MAVGADTGTIFRMVVGEGLALSGAGVALGLGVWVGHAVRNLLFGVGALDPSTCRRVGVDFLSVALAACYLSRAARSGRDAKITIRRIQLAVCTIHAEWRLAKSTAAPVGAPDRLGQAE